MLKEMLSHEYIQVVDEKLGWKEAIALAARPLVENGKIEERYIEAMYNKANEFGPFFDIGKQIAIPHARSEEGVKVTGLSYLRCNTPVYLMDKEDHPIDIFIVIAAADNTGHLKALSSLSGILIDDEKVNQLKSLQSASEIADFFRKEDE